jgi:hypothetical protein
MYRQDRGRYVSYCTLLLRFLIKTLIFQTIAFTENNNDDMHERCQEPMLEFLSCVSRNKAYFEAPEKTDVKDLDVSSEDAKNAKNAAI